MASYKLFKHMKCATSRLTSFNCNIYSTLRSFSTNLKTSKTVLCLKPYNSCIFCYNLKKFHESNCMKSDDTVIKANENSKDERAQGFDDEEFQNILKDVLKDFDVNDEAAKILGDIRKSIDEPKLGSDKLSESDGKNHNMCVTNNDLHSKASVKYKTFSDSDAVVIPSYEDYQKFDNERNEQTYHVDQEFEIKHSYHHMKRGIHGVFDIEELVEVLRKENLLDIAVISVPKELHYTDFMVLATAKSPRHCKAASELIRKLYKMKKHETDPYFIIEGQAVHNWKALDMGNIVVHILLEDTRTLYDIESLWLFDAEFDTRGNLKADPALKALEEQMAFFNLLQQSKETGKEAA
ncbi:uncharacterized protein LOC118191197 [Stegodyphus dumicola]|uniref:uncharacterized protein LOC118191197 n=1 Tax=Stegodyphus dumicola TaxID=202533 RepID=UPI0015AB396D|nr:uncharacterized protein LOC118191197 [Stegodyphus dumicola]